ncbi:MAG: DUF2695 domain-containing protein [Planctomycetota bacterium]|jgi:hypothetical protein
MPSKEEKRRRAKLVQEIADIEKRKEIEKMPISFKDLSELFNYLDEKLSTNECNHTPIMTKIFLESKNLNTEKILSWLEEYGGYCDCEVLANVEDSWESEINKNT